MADEALAWAVNRLAESGLALTASPEVIKDRPWSKVVRLTTAGGSYWLKVNRGGTTFEPALVAFLARIKPESVAAPLATQGAWSLQRDGGATLRQARGNAAPEIDAMANVLRTYADLQRVTAAHVGDLLALGVPDLRPERLPAELDSLLGQTEWLRVGEEGGLSGETYARLLRRRPSIADACAQLAGSAVPSALQHDDLHDNNVFVGSDAYRIFDWGDASVAHPFATLLVSLRSFADLAQKNADDPAVTGLRDAYLECWTDLAPRAELLRDARLASELAPIGRALSWQRALQDAGGAERKEWQEYVPSWLAELLS